MATEVPEWAKKDNDTLVTGDEQNPLVVLENAKSRADDPATVGSREQAIPYLTAQEKIDLGEAWQ
jgi:hypothetical protein